MLSIIGTAVGVGLPTIPELPGTATDIPEGPGIAPDVPDPEGPGKVTEVPGLALGVPEVPGIAPSTVPGRIPDIPGEV